MRRQVLWRTYRYLCCIQTSKWTMIEQTRRRLRKSQQTSRPLRRVLTMQRLTSKRMTKNRRILLLIKPSNSQKRQEKKSLTILTHRWAPKWSFQWLRAPARWLQWLNHFLKINYLPNTIKTRTIQRRWIKQLKASHLRRVSIKWTLRRDLKTVSNNLAVL